MTDKRAKKSKPRLTKNKTGSKSIAKPYERTEKEIAAAKLRQSRIEARTCAPKYNIKQDEESGKYSGEFDHPDLETACWLAMAEAGTGDGRFYIGLLNQLSNIGEPGKPISERSINFTLSVIGAVEPQNEIEAMLAVQMATVHQATMMMAKHLTQADVLPQQDSAERALNKLARTFTMQMDALKRYRATAQQTVRVERVTVNEGGQAIVGNVDRGGRGDGKK